MQGSNQRIVGFSMDLIGNDQPGGLHLEHRIKQRRIPHYLQMKSFFLGSIEPDLYLNVPVVYRIGKQKKNRVCRAGCDCLVAIHDSRRAREEHHGDCDRELGLEHGRHGALVTSEQALGFDFSASCKCACTAWNADSSSTFQFVLYRNGSERESQQAALASS